MRSATFLSGLLLGLLLAVGFMALSQESKESKGLRLEAAVGKCRYGKGQDGQWNKINYSTVTNLTSDCYSLGISQAPLDLPFGLRLGYRVSYIDFGLASADTFVPAIDGEANNFPSGAACDQSNFSGCVGEYKQWGRTKGFSLGPLIEKPTSYGTFGVEGGAYIFRSYWRVQGTVPGPGTCPTCSTPSNFDWNGAQGNHATWYVGLTYEIQGFFLQARMYHSIYASQASVLNDPLSIGMIGGPLYSAQVGYQFKF